MLKIEFRCGWKGTEATSNAGQGLFCWQSTQGEGLPHSFHLQWIYLQSTEDCNRMREVVNKLQNYGA